jgi:hypothetical protein
MVFFCLTYAISRAKSEWAIGKWWNCMLIFVREPFRVELLRVGEILGVKVVAPRWYYQAMTFANLQHYFKIFNYIPTYHSLAEVVCYLC